MESVKSRILIHLAFWGGPNYNSIGPDFVDGEQKAAALGKLGKLVIRGIRWTDEIIRVYLGKKVTKIDRLQVLAEKISLLDEEVCEMGLTHPEVKPVTDMFNKRKENLQGDDPVYLAEETQKCYQCLLEESDSLSGLLTSVVKTLTSSDREQYQAAANSISVEVPGR